VPLLWRCERRRGAGGWSDASDLEEARAQRRIEMEVDLPKGEVAEPKMCLHCVNPQNTALYARPCGHGPFCFACSKRIICSAVPLCWLCQQSSLSNPILIVDFSDKPLRR